MTDSSLNADVNNDERLFGLFSHLSIFFGGIIVPIIFWAINKDKSKFVSFHSLQALFFHIFFVVFIIFLVFLIIFGAVGGNIFFVKGGRHSAGPSAFFFLMAVLLYGISFLFSLGAICYSVYMAVKAYQGNLNKYPVIGSIIYKKIYGQQ